MKSDEKPTKTRFRRGFNRYKVTQPAVYPTSFESKIGFDAVRDNLLELCTSPQGAALVADMKFETDYPTVERNLQRVRDMQAALASDRTFPVFDVYPVVEHLNRARPAGTYVALAGMVLIRKQQVDVDEIVKYMSVNDDTVNPYPALAAVTSELDSAPEVVRAINAVVTREGDVKDTASPELADIRGQLRNIGQRIASAMRRVMARGVADGLIDADVAPSVRDGRLVIPVAPMHKRAISGIVHDESASGKTVFIEPAEVVELNNRQRELEAAEKREIVRILTDLTIRLRPHFDALRQNMDVMAQLDFIRAKARYARRVDAVCPHLSAGTELEWYGARHPILQEKLSGEDRTIVPLDITLTSENHILIISGPNAGGKSVSLKTTGIVQYMMQCGVLPTVYENSHMGIFDRIFADIGDDQSIEDELSTYSSHLSNMKHFVAFGNRRTLMLIDEFGTGTEPQIGGAIAQALLQCFNEKGIWGVITTHYQNLKTMAEHTPGLINGSMLYDRGRMQPLFRLQIGYPGSSFAIEIARKIGLPEDIIERASQIVGSDYVNLDKYLLDIARDKRYWEQKRESIRKREKHLEKVIEGYENDADRLRTSSRTIIDDARRQAEEIIAGSNARIERAIHEIRQVQAAKEETQKIRRDLTDRREQLKAEQGSDVAHPLLKKAPKTRKPKVAEPKPSAPDKPVSVGDNVLLDKQGRPGKVLEIDAAGKKATVAFGMLKTTVEVGRLTHTMRKDSTGVKAASFVSAATTDAMRTRQLDFKQEIDVRGMRADEALQAVTYFIDDALQFNVARVRILHGTGTGALRQAIRQYLATVPGVTSARDEDVRFGGAGITVVTL